VYYAKTIRDTFKISGT